MAELVAPCRDATKCQTDSQERLCFAEGRVEQEERQNGQEKETGETHRGAEDDIDSGVRV